MQRESAENNYFLMLSIILKSNVSLMNIISCSSELLLAFALHEIFNADNSFSKATSCFLEVIYCTCTQLSLPSQTFRRPTCEKITAVLPN